MSIIGLPYIIMDVPITSIEWAVVDKTLGAGLILVIVNISLKMYYLPATINKIKSYNIIYL